MNIPYRLFIFDWEGTIGEDTVGQVLNALELEAHRLQLGVLDKQLGRQYVDLGLAKAITKIFPDLSLYQYEQLLEAVQQSLSTCSVEVCLVPGAKRVIQKLHDRGYDLAIATNKGQPSLQRVLRHSGLDQFFTVTRCAGQAPPKPCPQMLEEIMTEFGVQPLQALMIGDSAADMEMASSIGVDVIGVDFYHQQAIALRAAGAHKVFDDYQQVEQYLQLS